MWLSIRSAVQYRCFPTRCCCCCCWTAGDQLPSPGRDVGSLSDNRLSEQERKEPLIILLATGGRHTHSASWMSVCVWVCVVAVVEWPSHTLLAWAVGERAAGRWGSTCWTISGCTRLIYCLLLPGELTCVATGLIWEQTNMGRKDTLIRGEDGRGSVVTAMGFFISAAGWAWPVFFVVVFFYKRHNLPTESTQNVLLGKSEKLSTWAAYIAKHTQLLKASELVGTLVVVEKFIPW